MAVEVLATEIFTDDASSPVSEVSDGQHTQRVVYAEEQQWADHKEKISDLYGRLTLPEVIDIMKKEHGFVGTQRQYKRRFSIWGVKKREIKPRDDRRLSPSPRLPSPKTVSSPVRQHRRPTHPFPGQLCLYLATKIPKQVPHRPEAFEKTMRMVQTYVGHSFENGTWAFSNTERMVLSRAQVDGWKATTQFYNKSLAATETLVKRGQAHALPIFDDCLSDLASVIPAQCPKLLIRIWRSLGRHLCAINRRESEFSTRLLRRFHGESVKQLDWSHGLSLISASMMELDLSDLRQLHYFDRVMTESLMGRSEPDCHMPAMAKHFSYTINIGVPVEKASLEKLVESAGPSMATTRCIEGRLSLVKVLHQGKLGGHAQTVLEDMRENQEVWSFIQDSDELSGGFYYYSGLLKKESGDLFGAWEDFGEAAAHTTQALGDSHGLTKRRKLACDLAYNEWAQANGDVSQ